MIYERLTAFTPLGRGARKERQLFAANSMEQECQNISASGLEGNVV